MHLGMHGKSVSSDRSHPGPGEEEEEDEEDEDDEEEERRKMRMISFTRYVITSCLTVMWTLCILFYFFYLCEC